MIYYIIYGFFGFCINKITNTFYIFTVKTSVKYIKYKEDWHRANNPYGHYLDLLEWILVN